jgi:hypothetical protein
LHRLGELQDILLYLDDSNKEKLLLISSIEKAERIKHLENQIISLKSKIDQLKQNFPFSIEELILDEDYIVRKKEELRIQIKTSEEEIIKYSDIINIIAGE